MVDLDMLAGLIGKLVPGDFVLLFKGEDRPHDHVITNVANPHVVATVLRGAAGQLDSDQVDWRRRTPSKPS